MLTTYATYADVYLGRSEMQRVGKLIIEDRDVENKLVEAIFNQNWSKKEPLQKVLPC